MTRQQLLILYLGTSDLGGPVVAWSLYDGAGKATGMAGDSETPPYASVLAAMQDGWRVIQLPPLPAPHPGHEHTVAHLRFEFVLEKLADV